MALGVDSAFNRKEYQEYFLKGKGGQCLGLKPDHIHVQIVLKPDSFKLLATSGPVQTCPGIPVPLKGKKQSHNRPG
jgi:hypothetical protein